MTRIAEDTKWIIFKNKIRNFWLIFYLNVISPILNVLGEGVERIDRWLDNKSKNHKAKRHYLHMLYEMDPKMAKIHKDIVHIKCLLILVMICILVLDIAVISLM